jgi:hypothetical protein
MHRNEQLDCTPAVKTIDQVPADLFGASRFLLAAVSSYLRVRTMAGDAHFVHNEPRTICTDTPIGFLYPVLAAKPDTAVRQEDDYEYKASNSFVSQRCGPSGVLACNGTQ